MKPVFQTRFGRPFGNCWAASIASILELPLEAVDWSADMTADEIEAEDGALFGVRMTARLTQLGYWQARGIKPDVASQLPPGAHYLVLGNTSSGVGHVVVGCEGRIVHDGNPKSGGLAEIEELAVLVRL